MNALEFHMLRFTLISLVLALVACSDDSAPANNAANNTNNQTSTNNSTSTNNPVNNPNNTNSNNTNNGDMGTDADPDMFEPDMEADMEPDMPDVTEQPCFHPASDPNCPPGVWGGAAMITEMVLPDDMSCCFDFSGNGTIDNRLGGLLGVAVNLGFDVNGGLASALRFGDVIYLLEFSGLSNTEYDPDFDLSFYTGRDTDFDFEPNYAGTGEVWVRQDALETIVPPQPKWGFGTASLNEGEIEASDGFLRLEFPGLLDEVRINVVQARLTATIDPNADLTAGGLVPLTDGKLGGVVLRNDFFASLNEASLACDCLGRAVYSRNANGTFSCNSTFSDEVNCEFEPAQGCRFLASSQYCSVLGTLSSSTDIDTNGDGTKDGYSFGATFTAVGTSIVGIDPF